MKNKPSYSLGSVDNALRLLQLLRDHGSIRVSEAAAELDIARSTAHRLLSMLVYRDFAMQDDHRAYVPGPALTAGQVTGRPLQQLRRVLAPPMGALCERVGETVNLMTRVGAQVRFLSTVESSQVLRVGDRQGSILPAHRASGGQALLAELAEEQLESLYRTGSAEGPASENDPSTSEAAWKQLLRALESARSYGFALNRDGTEVGVSAVGMCVHGASGQALGALSVSVPSARFSKSRIPELVRELNVTIGQAEVELAVLPELE